MELLWEFQIYVQCYYTEQFPKTQQISELDGVQQTFDKSDKCSRRNIKNCFLKNSDQEMGCSPLHLTPSNRQRSTELICAMDVSATFNPSAKFRQSTPTDNTDRLWTSAQIHSAQQSGYSSVFVHSGTTTD
jgi:hypothetical protein